MFRVSHNLHSCHTRINVYKRKLSYSHYSKICTVFTDFIYLNIQLALLEYGRQIRQHRRTERWLTQIITCIWKHRS